MSLVKTLKNEVLMKSIHKLMDERSKYIQAIEQTSISIDPNFFQKSDEIKIPKIYPSV